MISVLKRAIAGKQVQDLFSILGQFVKNTNPEKENGQGRQGHCDRGRSATTTDAKAVGPANNQVETMANNGNMQTRQLLLDRNRGSQS